jgi:hypothetical protein
MLTTTRSFIGGARFGIFNATFPFARLIVSPDKLSLRCIRTYDLAPKEVICTPCGPLPLILSGVRFHHIDKDYPDPRISWCFSRRRVLDALGQAGFEVQ